MRYYLDTEFNGMGGELISLAIVREDGPYMYIADDHYLKFVEWSSRSAICSPEIDRWVWDNVLPLLGAKGGYTPTWIAMDDFGSYLESFLRGDEDITIITDWPDDIKNIGQAAKASLALAEHSARYALPIEQLKGEPTGAMLVGGKRYLLQGDQAYGPTEASKQ